MLVTVEGFKTLFLLIITLSRKINYNNSTLIPLFSEDYEAFTKFFQQPIFAIK
jgi:hypothetical protein